MLTRYQLSDGHFRVGSFEDDVEENSWIDLLTPTKEEEARVESSLKIGIPTREEMREVESSSALYREGGGTFVTVRVVVRDPNQQPRLTSITLVMVQNVFVTIRYANPVSFEQFIARTKRSDTVFKSAFSAMLCLLETIVDRDADLLEEVGDRLDPISLEIFSQNAGRMKSIAAADLGRVLKKIGQSGDLTSRVRESLYSVGRAVPFLELDELPHDLSVRLKTLGVDVKSLLEHDNFLQTQVQFLLDSNLGLISIQQNAIMKALSVAAVVFLPPTLIGSIYGMNFDKIPELHWHFGYAFALMLMVFSAVGPLLYFRAKQWL